MTDRVFHVIGPPGTGKTNYLAKQAENAVHARGSKSTLICSLTRAAAREISGRNTLVADDMIGTLHAHAFRALGQPEIAETHIDEWNDQCAYEFKLTDTKKSLIDAPEDNAGTTDGDELLSMVNILRASMTPWHLWVNQNCRNFYQHWTDWKTKNNYLDFTDMIETAINEVPVHPANPSVILGDEAQDWSKLEAKLFREVWGKHADTVIMAGDEDQTIFEWRGSDPHIFSGYPIPEGNTMPLEQSYRVPLTVHAEAQQWIRRITNRVDVKYQPRDAEGRVKRVWTYTYKNPNLMIDELSKLEGTVMILASCGYMINYICSILRKYGVPFHNPYRPTHGGWNPLLSRKNTVSASDRLCAFLSPDNDHNGNVDRWSKEAMQRWIPLLTSKGLLRYGVKEMVKAGDFKLPQNATDWNLIFNHEEDISSCLHLNLNWFAKKIPKSKRMDYPIAIARNGKLMERPKIIVGTIHSVKGGEVDHVYVFPDISYRAKQEGNHSAIIRMFYVAMTRARETLTLCGPATHNTVVW